MRALIAALSLAGLTAHGAVAYAPYLEPTPQPAFVFPVVYAALPDTDLPDMDGIAGDVSQWSPPAGFVRDDLPMPPHRPTAIARIDGDLLAKARKYLGTNPTGWAHLWCARFMAMIAPELARKIDNPNWARDWADLPKVKPRPGVIVVLRRGNGGHIGVVSGFDRRGNPRVVSGNHNRRVAEAVYPKSRVIAYVSPRG